MVKLVVFIVLQFLRFFLGGSSMSSVKNIVFLLVTFMPALSGMLAKNISHGGFMSNICHRCICDVASKAVGDALKKSSPDLVNDKNFINLSKGEKYKRIFKKTEKVF